MKWVNFILVSIFLLFSIDKISAETFRVVESEFFWSSPNFTKVGPIEDKTIKKRSAPLGSMSYKDYIDLHGTPPSFNFLRRLREKDSSLAQIKGGHIFFRKTGKKIPLNRSIVPYWANPIPPYLVSIPIVDRVLVVYPYYLYQDKENRYFTEIYSGQGVLLSTFDSLPTHLSPSNPYLLISPERSGCCESLKWSIRFYNLREGTVSEYSCPEGYCGNVLFTRLGKRGPFVIAQEIVGKMGEIGASIQTNFFIVDDEAKLLASGKAIYAVRESNMDQKRLEILAPYSISNLISIDPLHEKDSWVFHFGRNGKKGTLKLVSLCRDPIPSVTFLLAKDPSIYARRVDIKMAEKVIGNLPLLFIAGPGQYTFLIQMDGEKGERLLTKEIQSEQINVIMFE